MIPAGAKRIKKLYGKIVTENPRLRLHEDEVTLPSGRRATHWKVDYRFDGVGVVPVLPSGRVLLGLHHRYCPDAHGWEIAAGGVAPGEDHLVAAIRELEEETAHRAGRLEFLLDYFPAPGLGNEHFFVYVAQDLEPLGHKPDEDEILELRSFSWRQIEELIAEREILCGFTLTSLLAARVRGLIPDGPGSEA
jgi:ADP-ribose pyrophosphatase